MSKNECLIVENVDGGATSTVTQSARHLTLLVDENKDGKIDSILKGNKKCRSFFRTKCSSSRLNLFPRLKKVRVLVLDSCQLEVIPSEIGGSIHLRYLDLSWNKMKELPKEVCDLYNLETLVLEWCVALSTFPQGIEKLRKLRHLLNEETDIEFPEGIEKLNLKTLGQINANSRTKWRSLKFLGKMKNLGGSLVIVVEGLEEEDADSHHLLLEAAEKAELKKKFIRELKLKLDYRRKVPMDVVEALQPRPDLEILDFTGPCLPKWLANLTNLRKLQVEIRGESEGERTSFSSLLALGKLLSSLEELQLIHKDGKKIPNREEMYTTFPKLKELRFYSCWKWEEWEDISEEEENNIHLSIFPSLHTLKFYRCEKLKALPHRLLRKCQSLRFLQISMCNDLEESYKDWETVSQLHGLSHITATIRQ